jgi:hypothetical protein
MGKASHKRKVAPKKLPLTSNRKSAPSVPTVIRVLVSQSQIIQNTPTTEATSTGLIPVLSTGGSSVTRLARQGVRKSVLAHNTCSASNTRSSSRIVSSVQKKLPLMLNVHIIERAIRSGTETKPVMRSGEYKILSPEVSNLTTGSSFEQVRKVVEDFIKTMPPSKNGLKLNISSSFVRGAYLVRKQKMDTLMVVDRKNDELDKSFGN